MSKQICFGLVSLFAVLMIVAGCTTTSNQADVTTTTAAAGTTTTTAGSGTTTTTAGGATTTTLWVLQSSGTANDLNGVYFTDLNKGCAVGNAGTFLWTTNGGSNWNGATAVPATTNNLNGVCFPPAPYSNYGWAVGANGTIFKTTNSGANWTSQTSGTTNELYGVFFACMYNGWAVGANGTFLYTTNGGSNWTSRSLPITVHYYAVDSGDGGATVWIAGGNGTLMKTTNNGVSWNQRPTGTTNNLKAVHYYATNAPSYPYGCAVGQGGVVLHTTNGTDWAAPSGWSGTEDLNGGAVVYAATNAPPAAVFAAGNGGTVWASTNQGAAWAKEGTGTGQNIKGMCYATTNAPTEMYRSWAVGEGGVIINRY